MPLDLWIAEALPDRAALPWFDAAMIAATTVGLVVPLIAIPTWLYRRAPDLARHCMMAMIGGLAATLILQLLCGRPRPELIDPLLAAPALPSFPSGHAVLLCITATVLAAYDRRSLLLSIPWVIAVGLSRVHVGHHHGSDVIAGMLIGTGIGLAAIVRARAPVDDPWRLRWVLWPQIGLVLAATIAAYAGVFSSGHQRWLTVPGMDKALHFLLFGLVAFGLHLHLRGRTIAVLGRAVPLAISLPLVGATLEELVQALSPHRTADLLDLVADLLGLVVFGSLGRWLTSRPGHVERAKGT